MKFFLSPSSHSFLLIFQFMQFGKSGDNGVVVQLHVEEGDKEGRECALMGVLVLVAVMSLGTVTQGAAHCVS